jgi:type I restriction enzyme, S subunit
MEFIDTTIGAVSISTKTGKTPDTKEPLYYNGSIPWVTPTDLKGQQFISNTNTRISDLALIDNEAFLHKENTILISCIGDIGKVAIVKEQVSSNQQITGVRVNESLIEPKFFYYWLVNNKEYLTFKANRVTISILNNTNLQKLRIKFPRDLEFQRKVASYLDLIQEIITNKVNQLSTFDLIIKSTFVKFFGDTENNQKAYPVKRLSQITDKNKIITYGIVQPGNHIEGGIPFIRTGDLKNGKINKNLRRTNVLISNQYSRTICSFNDLVITIRATIGETAKITKEQVGFNISRELALITPNLKIINPNYLLATLMSDGFKSKLDKYIKGAAIKGISLDEFRSIEIPIPPIGLQNKFSYLYEEIEEIKSKVERSLEILQQLFQVILQNAFREDTQIEEEPIFKDLIKKFSIQDLQGNKQRLQYLINLFEQQNFDEFQDFTNARKVLFELMESDEIVQILDDGKVKLQVK